MLSKKVTIITILVLISLALIGQDTASNSFVNNSIISDKNINTSDAIQAASELENFFADIENESVLINWDLNNINDVLGFEMYKSTDGATWEMIGYVEGDDTEDNSYNFVDETPNWGVNFYRIKMIDMGGNYGFLKTTKVVFEYTTGADVGDFYPNPATNGVTNLNINIPDGGVATIYIHDGMGKLVETYQKTIESGADTVSFDLNDLTYGIYFAKISINRESYVKKFMVRMSK